MRNFNQWITEYSVSHKNPTNKKIHNFCVPAIMLSLLGLIYLIPFPQDLGFGPIDNWAVVFIIPCLLFYLSLNRMIFIGMLFLAFFMLSIIYLVGDKTILLYSSIIVFVVAWIGQFYGHKIEGKKPSFLQDLVFLLIGPIWVIKNLYDKMGVKY